MAGQHILIDIYVFRMEDISKRKTTLNIDRPAPYGAPKWKIIEY